MTNKTKTEIIGNAYVKLKARVKQFAKEDYPVLFAGERGCGKELLARFYMDSNEKHEKERRTVNCAAFTEAVLDSEVFGHKKGAFTGAVTNRKGLIKTCDQGILFLDELGEASPEFQSKILRVIQGDSFRAVGSDDEETPNTLFIGATNNLSKVLQVLKDRFHILPVPPLQNFDIPLLAEHFMGKPLKDVIVGQLMGREFPGNVRELKKCIERLKIEHGDRIFKKNKSSRKYPIGDTFDYERFETEYLAWHQHIQPLLDKYELDFRYKYLLLKPYQYTRRIKPEEGEKSVPISWGGELIPEFAENLNTQIDLDISLIDELKKGRKELVPKFAENLKAQIEKGGLPYLLPKLDLRASFHPLLDVKPDLSPLLDLPPNQAETQFELLYYDYHLKQNGGDTKKTAKVLGFNINTFNSKLARFRKKARDIPVWLPAGRID